MIGLVNNVKNSCFNMPPLESDSFFSSTIFERLAVSKLCGSSCARIGLGLDQLPVVVLGLQIAMLENGL